MAKPYRVAAPADIEFELEDGQVYRVSGDPDVELLATLLEVEEALKGAGSLSPEELTGVVVRGRDMILHLIQEKMPEVESIRVGVSGIMQLIALIVGNDSAAEEVAELLAEAASANFGEEGDDEAAAAKRAELEAGAATEDAEPVPLDKRSRRSSSASAKRGSGRRTGGKASPGASSEPSSTRRRAAAG